MKKKPAFLSLVLMFSILLWSCSKNEKDIIPKTDISKKNVYAAGFIEEDSKNKAVYWRNDTLQQLQINEESDAFSIFVKDKDIYVCGYDVIDNVGKAVIWKNGKRIFASEGNTTAIAFSIFVKENDVYAAGQEFVNGVIRPVYWKNGSKTILSNKMGGASAIWVSSNNDVYIGGTDLNNTQSARLWKNNELVALPSNQESNSVSSIFVKDNIVFLGGYESAFINGTMVTTPLVWKNQLPTNYSENTLNSNYVSSICISGTNIVIAAGTEYNYQTNKGSAKLWKDGQPFILNKISDSFESHALSVFESNGIIYTAGLIKGSTNKTSAVIWKNAAPILLTDGESHAIARSVFVN